MLNNQYDLIIIGGGCAGLSLAMQLSELGDNCPNTLIIEARAEYTNDRTWCFWQAEHSRMTHLATHQWPTISVKMSNNSADINCQDSPYTMLPAITFYEEALSQIAKNSRIQWLRSSKMTAASVKVENYWLIKIAEQSYYTNYVVDTRPAKPMQAEDAILWQSFYGVDVECTEDIFDVNSVVLMDFTETEHEAVCFNYILPTSPKTALIEFTVFGAQPLTIENLQNDLHKAIKKYVGHKMFTISRAEHGILPMGYLKQTQPKDNTYIFAGLFSGAARPSTGYAFQRIQRWAEECAKSIAQTKTLKPHASDTFVLQKMDRLFLQVIRHHYKQAPAIFYNLFEKCRTDIVIRFLSDQATLTDYCMIVVSMPTRLFLLQIAHNLKKLISEYVPLKSD